MNERATSEPVIPTLEEARDSAERALINHTLLFVASTRYGEAVYNDRLSKGISPAKAAEAAIHNAVSCAQQLSLYKASGESLPDVWVQLYFQHEGLRQSEQ